MKIFLASLLMLAMSCAGQSLYSSRPPDPLAVTADNTLGLRADGIADDTNALQAAIDRVADTSGTGIVFLPQGRYRITHTLHLWSGIRLIGYGVSRPVLTLAASTPGYQSGHDFLGTGRYMLQFASRKVAPGAEIVDANEFTFYSGVSNIDFEVGDGNPAAICIRFHVAQHSFLSHIHFVVGHGHAALEDVGNQADTLAIEGGGLWHNLGPDVTCMAVSADGFAPHGPADRCNPYPGSWHDAGARHHRTHAGCS